MGSSTSSDRRCYYGLTWTIVCIASFYFSETVRLNIHLHSEKHVIDEGMINSSSLGLVVRRLFHNLVFTQKIISSNLIG